MSNRHIYSDKYSDNQYEYRTVKLNMKAITKPDAIANIVPLVKQGKILTEDQWRALNIESGPGWEHVGYKHGEFVLQRRLPVSTPSLLMGAKSTMIEASDDETFETRYELLRCLWNKYPVGAFVANEINEKHLSIIFDWTYEVLMSLDYNIKDSSRILGLSSYILYMYLQKTPNLPRKQIQLYSIAALSLAIKMEEDLGFISVSQAVYMCANACTAETFIDAEVDIVNTLGFSLKLPTVHRFLYELDQRFNVTEYQVTRLFANMAIISGIFPKYPPYVVAEACFGLVTNAYSILEYQRFISDSVDLYEKCQQELVSELKKDNKYYNNILKDFKKEAKQNRIANIDINDSISPLTKNAITKGCCRNLSDELQCDTTLTYTSKTQYKIDTKLGEGTYGIVNMASDVLNPNRKYARKRSKEQLADNGLSQSVLREIAYMKEINHPGVVKIIDPVASVKDNSVDFYMDFMTQFRSFIKGKQMKITQVRDMTTQFMSAITYIHKSDIIHRDLKPANMLINAKNELKVTDFGAAIWVWTDKPKIYNDNVVTLWYRAPELLARTDLGPDIRYNKSLDMWSVGCIIAEMITGIPIFIADDREKMLLSIAKYLNLNEFITGKITGEQMISKYPVFTKAAIRKIIEKRDPEWNLPEHQKDLDDICDLLGRLLALDPKYRITAKEAMSHPFIAKEVNDLSTQLSKLGIKSSPLKRSSPKKSSPSPKKSPSKVPSPKKSPSISLKEEKESEGTLKKHTVKDLRVMAKQRNLTGYSRLRKQELVDILK